MAETAVGAIRAQMESGYGRPIRRTGALMADVHAAAAPEGARVGNSLAYAPLVHSARPYLADAMAGCAAALQAAAGPLLGSGLA